jgi:hypothetical protein
MVDQEPAWIRWPYARIRRSLKTERGEVIQFTAQLEYDVQATPSGQNTPEWRTVARFDHDANSLHGHDVAEEGLHLDIYRNEEEYKVKTAFPPVPLSRAFRYCEEYLTQHADYFLQQFEEWHDLRGPWRV